MESLVILMASIVTVVPPLVVLAIIFRIAKEMKHGMFSRFFKVLEVAFVLITAQAILMPLALNGIASFAVASIHIACFLRVSCLGIHSALRRLETRTHCRSRFN